MSLQHCGWALLVMVSAVPCLPQQPSLSNLGSASSAKSEDATISEARKLIAGGKFAQAEAALRVYLRSNDLSTPGHELLAYTLLRENKPKESLAEYTRAAAIRTPTAEDLKNVGQDYALLDDFTEADHWTLRAVEMDQNDADAWYSLGRIRYTEQRFRDAVACYERVLKLSPKNVKAENNLGLAYDAMNQPEDAMTAYRQAVAWQAQGPADQVSEQPLINLGTVLLHRGELVEAESLLGQARKIAPRDPKVLEQIGHLYMQQSKFKEAQAMFQEASGLDPKNGSLHYMLGQADRRLGLKQQADEEFAMAAKLTSGSPVVKTK